MGAPHSEALAVDAEATLRAALAALEATWLAPGRPFMAGGAEPSVADLQCCCELEQLALLPGGGGGGGGGDAAFPGGLGAYTAPHPRVRAWMAAVRAACEPAYGEAHAVLRRSAAAAGSSGAPKL
jgi:glutathione S-transferase